MSAGGFTIVETLIVLAVTGMILLAAIILISGRTGKTEFMTASNDLKQQLQQVMNETASGYFPNSSNFTCTAGINTLPTLSNSTSQQGTNGGCIFLGKVLQFGATDQPDQLVAYAIAGNRLQSGTNQEVTSLAQSYPVAVAPGASNNAALTGITVSMPLESGLTVASMKYAGGDTGGVALLSTLASYTAGGNDCKGVCSGAQGFDLYAIASTKIGTQDGKSFVDTLDASAAGSYVKTPTVTICLNSGSTDESVVYTLGADNNPQAVDMQINQGSCS